MLWLTWMTFCLLAAVYGSPYWTWNCVDNKCVKSQCEANKEAISARICWLTCNEYANIWPMPHGKFEIDRTIQPIDLSTDFTVSSHGNTKIPDDLFQIMKRFFNVVGKYNNFKNATHPITKTKIHFDLDNTTPMKISLENDEKYVLDVSTEGSHEVKITIKSGSLFGARHALETLSQVIIFNEVTQNYIIPRRLLIEDGPKYPLRGILVDTARNFISVPTIKRIIEGMAVDKLNNFHWHITDSQSFPYESKYLPELSLIGAYSSDQVYSQQDVRDIVEFARIRGVRVMPEFDGPSHVGEGWQETGFVKCFGKQPWGTYCKEPPCGIFDPTNDQLYSTLKLLFRDMIEAFDPDIFHFGGDEVVFNCWRTIDSIKEWMKSRGWSTLFDSGYVNLWSYYQNQTYDTFMGERHHPIPGILWTSTLTDTRNLHLLPNDKYIIQVWTTMRDKTIKNLLENDYRIIFSNYDRLYLDCGFQHWLQGGSNWCSPYIGWQKVYENSPAKIVSNFGEDANKPHLIMGAESALWSETIQDTSMETRIWPRASAMGERLWAEPESSWQDAALRLDSQRERLEKLGVGVDSVMPQWCHLNEGGCPILGSASTSGSSRREPSLFQYIN